MTFGEMQGNAGVAVCPFVFADKAALHRMARNERAFFEASWVCRTGQRLWDTQIIRLDVLLADFPQLQGEANPPTGIELYRDNQGNWQSREDDA